MKERQGGPWVPVRIEIGPRDIHPETGELEEPEKLVAVVGIDEIGSPVALWTYLQPISVQDYDALVERVRSDARMKATRVQVDLSTSPTRPRK
jgi:hypothetical protein